MGSTKILKVAEPIVRTYPAETHFLTVLSAYEQETLGWTVSNFIHLFCRRNLKGTIKSSLAFTFGEELYGKPYLACPWLKVNLIEPDIIQSRWKDTTEFVKDCIDRDRYVCMLADRYELKCTNSYQRDHFFHEIFIYGYNDEKKEIYCADFFHEGLYCFETVSYDELNLATEKLQQEEWPQPAVLLCYSQKENDDRTEYKYGLDPVKIKVSLETYIGKREYGTISKDLQNKAYDLDTYAVLCEYLDRTAKENLYCDLRIFHMLYEHKKLMEIRVRELMRQSLAPDAEEEAAVFAGLRDRCMVLRNRVLKSNMLEGARTKIRFEATQELERIREEESAAIRSLIDKIRA